MAVTIIPFNPGEPYLPFRDTIKTFDQLSQLQNRNIQNQFLPEHLRIGNALKQNELNFAPGMSAAELKLKQQMAPYYGALTGEAGARTRKLNQEIDNPNLGGEGSNATIAYGKWLQQNHPDIYAEGMKRVPGNPGEEVTLDTQVPSLPQLFGGKQVGIPTGPKPLGTQGLANFPIPQMPQFQPRQLVGATPDTMQKGPVPIGPELIQSGLDQAKAKPMLAQMRMGNMGGVGGQLVNALQQQLMKDHPDWDPATANQAASSYLDGEETLPDGTPLPPPSGIAQSMMAQIQKKNSNATIQKQAGLMRVLSSDMDRIEAKYMPSMQAFAGVKGKARYLKEASEMARGRPVSNEFRDYQAFKNEVSKYLQDSLRKGFDTTVQPEYVQALFGKASDPTSTLWNDPQQVMTEWKASKDYINHNDKLYRRMATQGVGSSDKPMATEGSQSPKAGNEIVKKIGDKTYKQINGEWYET